MENFINKLKEIQNLAESLVSVSAPIPSEKVEKYVRALDNLQGRFEKEFVDSCCEDYLNTLSKEK